MVTGLLLVALAAAQPACPAPAAASAAAPPAALAEALRAWMDRGDEAPLATLHATVPGDDDVAWWVGRARLDRGDTTGALAAVEGRAGRNLPCARFPALRAEALAPTDPRRAREELDLALARATGDDRRALLPLHARLALAEGDRAAALAAVLEAGGRVDGLRVWSWRRPGLDLYVEVERQGFRLGADGLAVAGTLAPGAVREGRGPDLVDERGAPCLAAAAPGLRVDPVRDGAGWLYAAQGAPEGSGLYTLARCGAAPRREAEATAATSPARAADGTLWWVEGGALVHAGHAAFPGVDAIRLAAAEGRLFAVVTEGGTFHLREIVGDTLVAPLADDPPITRASGEPG